MSQDVIDGQAAVIANLRALIDALDSRVPHLERIGEQAIADDASELKAQALAQLATLQASGA